MSALELIADIQRAAMPLENCTVGHATAEALKGLLQVLLPDGRAVAPSRTPFVAVRRTIGEVDQAEPAETVEAAPETDRLVVRMGCDHRDKVLDC